MRDGEDCKYENRCGDFSRDSVKSLDYIYSGKNCDSRFNNNNNSDVNNRIKEVNDRRKLRWDSRGSDRILDCSTSHVKFNSYSHDVFGAANM